MNCPLFIDFTRECMKDIGYCPQDTLEYCLSEKYSECPFYKVVNKIGMSCGNIKQCTICKLFSTSNFEAFKTMTGAYCLTENMKTCQRYLRKENGDTVPDDLLPDGTTLPEKE